MSILAINSGSSSLKFGLFDADAREALLAGEIDCAHAIHPAAARWLHHDGVLGCAGRFRHRPMRR
jgi:acetate kinase